MEPFEIIKDIYIVGGPEITDPRDGCVYLLNLGELVLIDSGAGWSVDKIVQNIEKLGFGSHRLKSILLTHCHIDHIGGVPEFRKMFGVKVYIHKLDAIPLEKGDPILTAATWYQTTFPPTPVDMKLNLSEELLRFGEENLICLHTPGHTPGSISVYIDKSGKRILFGQDIHGPFMAEFGSDIGHWQISMEKLLALKADVLCEGHFGVYRPNEKVTDYIERYLDEYGDRPL